MVVRSRRWLVLAVLVLAFAPAAQAQDAASTGWRPRPVRTGTVSLGGQVLYGALLGGGTAGVGETHRFSEDFNHGVGVGFNLRYRTASDAAVALSFESHNFGVKVPTDSAAGFDHLQIITTTLDYMKYGATRSRMPHYLTIGVGLAQTRITDNDGEKEFPGDGGVVKLGAGLEYWGWRTLSLELGVRYYGVLLRSKLNHDVQAGIGFNFYTSP
jgi:opacity protein-like surface antigen